MGFLWQILDPLWFLRASQILRFNCFIISNVGLQKSRQISLFWFFSLFISILKSFFFLNFPLFIELKFYLGHFLSSSPYLIYYVGTHNDKNLFPLTYLQQPKIALHHSISITIITMEKLKEKEKTGLTHTKKSKWIVEK